MTALDGTRSELVRAAEELIDPERLADIVMAMAGSSTASSPACGSNITCATCDSG